jgi:phosphoribosylanthranilate isomerase
MKIKVCGMRDADNIRALIQLPIDYIGFIFYEKSARYVELMPELKDSKRFQEIKKVGVFVNAEIDFILNKIKEFNLDVVQLHGKETPQYVGELNSKIYKLNPKYLELKSKLDLIKNDIDSNGSKLKTMRQELLMNHFNLSVINEKNLAANQSKVEIIKKDLALINSKSAILQHEMGRSAARMEMIENELNKIDSELDIWKVFSVDETFDFKDTEPYEGTADKFLFDTKTPHHGGSGQKFDWDILRKYTGQTPFFLSGGISASDTEGVKNISHPQFFGLDLNSKFEISPALKDTATLKEFLNSLNLL